MLLYYKSHIIAEASRKLCCRLHLCLGSSICVVVVVDLLFYVHGKHLRSCRDGQLT